MHISSVFYYAETPSAANDALSGIVISSGTLVPTFNFSTYSYNNSIVNSVSSITITPTSADPSAGITINGVSVTSGSPSNSINMNVGDNTITIIVTARTGITSKTYTIVVHRISIDATLYALTTSSGTLSPSFSLYQYTYALNLINSVSSVTLTPQIAPYNIVTSIKVNGVAISSGSTSSAFNLSVGAYTAIPIVVTAEDGVTTNTYTVNLHRMSNVATLSGLTISSGTLSPTFSSITTSYTDSVTSGITSVTITPTATESHATITVNGSSVTSGSNSQAINLSVGSNSISIVVTAEDGTINTYSLAVTRVPSSDATLSSFSVTGQTDNIVKTLSPTFIATTVNYSTPTEVWDSSPSPVANRRVTIKWTTANPYATTVDPGNTSGTISYDAYLNDGPNAFSVIVTAQDGITVKTYTVNIFKQSQGFYAGYGGSLNASNTAVQEIAWTVPVGVTSISVVLVGAGGGGGRPPGKGSYYISGGGGGALAYGNDIAVTAGSTLKFVSGPGGGWLFGMNGTASYLKNAAGTIILQAGGGIAGTYGSSSAAAGAGGNPSGTSLSGGGSGGAGGSATSSTGAGGGGGAGGYSGAGGRGGTNGGTTATAGSGGGGGGGGAFTTLTALTQQFVAAGGGGVGVAGQGTSGAAGANGYNTATGGGGGSYNSTIGIVTGLGGSSSSSSTYNGTTGGGLGGVCGGGGGGGSDGTSNSPYSGEGNDGGWHFIWPGLYRKFPSTNVII